MSRERLRIIVRTPATEWTPELLRRLTQEELGSIAALLGIGARGRKVELVERLLAVRDLRVVLSRFGGNEGDDAGQQVAVDELAAAYKGRELRVMCRTAQVYQGRTKRAMAVSLIQWRNACRSRGHQALQNAKEAARAEARPVQTRFF